MLRRLMRGYLRLGTVQMAVATCGIVVAMVLALGLLRVSTGDQTAIHQLMAPVLVVVFLAIIYRGLFRRSS